MKTKLAALLFAGIFLSTSFAFAATESMDSKSAEEKLKIAREQIAEDAAFIRQVNNDPGMTPAQRKEAIAEFLSKQNEKTN